MTNAIDDAQIASGRGEHGRHRATLGWNGIQRIFRGSEREPD
jgi:hypothetical protein